MVFRVFKYGQRSIGRCDQAGPLPAFHRPSASGRQTRTVPLDLIAESIVCVHAFTNAFKTEFTLSCVTTVSVRREGRGVAGVLQCMQRGSSRGGGRARRKVLQIIMTLACTVKCVCGGKTQIHHILRTISIQCNIPRLYP